jgi:hypothetical protein
MAYDDDDDERRRLADEAERRWKAERESERSRRLYEARRRGDEDSIRWLLGIPSAPSGPGGPDRESPDPAERVAPLRPELGLPGHQRALLLNLQSAAGILSFPLAANWAGRVERLDLGQPQAALAELRAIREEFLRATGRAGPPVAQIPQPTALPFEVEAVGLEIDCLIALLSSMLYAT